MAPWVFVDTLDKPLQDKVIDPFSDHMSFGLLSCFSGPNIFKRGIVYFWHTLNDSKLVNWAVWPIGASFKNNGINK